MNSHQILTQLSQHKVVPVITLNNSAQAAPLADTLVAGQLPVAEITFRTPDAAQSIAAMLKRQPKMLVGAGTLLNTDDLLRAIDAGAHFGVAPGLNPTLVEEAQKRNFLFCPGVATPSEIERGLALGLRFFKLFPAENLGGVAYLKSLLAAYRHTGLKIMPTGGITYDKSPAYLAIPEVCAVGGSWVVDKENLEQGNWQGIQQLCQSVQQFDTPFDSPTV